MDESSILRSTDAGIHCQRGGFHVDPHRRVPLAIVTHAHGDHARRGMGRYLCAAPGVELLRRRIGRDADVIAYEYGERFRLGQATVSLHPAGHVLGSSQVRIEVDGEVWVVSGDYKRDPDPTCAPFEVVPCDVFLTEATFARPDYAWPKVSEVFDEIVDWWAEGRECKRTSVLFAYALGKAQRVLAELGQRCREPVWLHGAIEPMVQAYRDSGVAMPVTRSTARARRGTSFAGALVLAPPPAIGTPWMKRFGDCATGFVSGWMLAGATGPRGRRYDRGFTLSDHADWPALVRTVEETGARRVLLHHGGGADLAKHLRRCGLEVEPFDLGPLFRA